MFTFTKTFAMAVTKHRKLLVAIAISLTTLSNACASDDELPDAPAFYSAMEYQAKEQRKRIKLSPSTDLKAPLLSEGIELPYAFPSDLNEYILNLIRSPHDLSQIALLNRSFCLWASKRILTLYTLAQRDREHYKVDDDSLQSVLRKKKSQLRVLSLAECGRLSNEALSKTVPQFCPELVALDLSGCYKLTNAGLDTIISMLPDLTVLRFRDCANVTGDGLGASGKVHAALKSIELSGGKITDTTLEQLVIRFPNLTSLDIGGRDGRITGIGIEMLARRVPRLRYLNLGGHEKLGKEVIETIIANFHELRLLDLSCCFGGDSFKRFTDALPKLEIIVSSTEIKLGASINDTYLMHFLHSYDYCVLEYLDLSNCPLLTEETIIKVLINFSSFLQVVKFRGCNQITDKTLEAIASNQPKRGRQQLRHINIEGCDKVTESGLAAIRASHPKIEILQ